MEKTNGKIRVSSGELVLMLKLPMGTMLGNILVNLPQTDSFGSRQYGSAFEPWYEIHFIEPVKEKE